MKTAIEAQAETLWVQCKARAYSQNDTLFFDLSIYFHLVMQREKEQRKLLEAEKKQQQYIDTLSPYDE